MPRSLFLRSLLLVALLALAGFGLAGCGDSDRFSYAAEIDEPSYREGLALLKSGRRQEALTAFLKVIDKRRDDAPESHLEVGLLYVQHINDPLSAIYHFRKYLALRPNSPQAPLVRQRIDAAIREFARTLPAQPLEDKSQRVDLIATLDRLKQENETLKQQLAEARAAKGMAPLPETANLAAGAPATSSTPTGGGISFSVEAVPTVRTRPNAATTTVSTRTSPPPASTLVPPKSALTPPTRPAPGTLTAPAGGRRHTVQPGDTLSKIALQYYNDRAKWRDIYAANRGVMKNETDLKVGTQLKIP